MRFIIASLLLCAASTAHANGFVLNDHGAQATGRAGAVVATVDNGSAVAHNPGGLAIEDGTNIYVGASLILASASFTQEGTDITTDTTSPPAVTPTVYATSRVHELVTVGLGFHTPFGSRIEWPHESPGADESTVQQLRSFFITPVVGLNLGQYVPGLTIGGGLDLVPASVLLEQDIWFGQDTGTAVLGGTAFGVGGRVGVIYQPPALPQLSVGAAWRSAVRLDFAGNGDFDAPAPFRSQLPPDGDISASITLPQTISGGVAFRAMDNLEFEVDAIFMGWSAVDQLELVLTDTTLVLPRDYTDTVSIRVGAEFSMPEKNLDLRVGYMYDPSPIPADRLTVSLPDKDRHDITAGASYHLQDGKYNIDFGMLWVLPGDRDTADTPDEPALKGTFGVTALVTSLSLGAKF